MEYEITKSAKERNKCRPVDTTNALDFALKCGWCATQFRPSFGSIVTKPENGNLTEAQINAIFDASHKYDVKIDYSELTN